MDLTRYPDLVIDLRDTFATACAALGLKPQTAVEGKLVVELSATSPGPSRIPNAAQAEPAKQ